MSLPPSVSEEEFVRVVERTAKLLYKRVGTLLGTRDDFRQQVALWALEAMPSYDARRPLEGFIFTHTRNRALNWVRKHYHRSDPPCAKCHAGSPCGEGGDFCPKYAKWARRNQTKADLARPVGLDDFDKYAEAISAEDEVVGRELFKLIDEQLPIDLRAPYLRMLAGDKEVPLAHRRKVQHAVAEILGLTMPAESHPSQGAKEAKSSERNAERERLDSGPSYALEPANFEESFRKVLSKVAIRNG